MAASSSAADVFPQQKYDVFLSFRGEDTRHDFTSHLYAALGRKKIYTFKDDTLERGDEIKPALLTAIEQSKLSVIIFSKDYASSGWCLDELVHILKCKQDYRQLVVPIFYHIDPSDVRSLKGTYADAFAFLVEKFKNNMNKVCGWRAALTTAGNLSGVHSENIGSEYELVETIVDVILTKLNRNSSYAVKGKVGMERRIQEIESLLCFNTQDVCYRTIGIWGMGGVGKTTLADAVFHRNSSKFEAYLFLRNVGARSEAIDGLYCLRDELLSKLLQGVNVSIDSPSIGSSFIIDRLSRTKVLIVLDDVSKLDQLEILLGEVKFGRGSRIIITTRNRRLLKKRVHEDHIYKMTELCVDEALQLFQSIVFEDDSCVTDYSNLSRKVVNYAGRNPLALNVLASSFLHCENREDWEEELNKLKKNPNPDIQKVLRISYDRLGEEVKEMFLDIACFLKGPNKRDGEKMLEMLGYSASSKGIGFLIDMSLISIINNRLEMHDLLQEMGRAIDNAIEEPGKRKRLWNARDADQVLHYNTGPSPVKAIFLDVSKIQEIQLSAATLKDMRHLKLLKFYVPQEVHEERERQKTWSVEEKQLSSFPWLPGFKAVQSFLAKSRIWESLKLLDVYRKVCNYDDKVLNEYCKVYLPGGLESLPEELRYLYWDGYPLKSLPSQYSPKNLVELHLPHSQVKQLWNNVQNLCPNIKRIDLSECTNLVEVPSDFQNLDNLTYLNMKGCTNLKIFCELPCNLEELCLSGTAIEEISPSIWSHEKLHTLDLGYCRFLKNLPSSSNNTGKLKRLILNGLVLESVPDNIYNSNCLETLDLSWCEKLKRLPPMSVGRLCCLRALYLGRCRVLESIPDNLLSISTLEAIDLSETMIESIPSGIINVSWLVLKNCKKLKVIPELTWQIGRLEVGGSTSLKSVASSRPWVPYKGFVSVRLKIIYTDCLEFDVSARTNIIGDTQLTIVRRASLSSKDSKLGKLIIVICPGNEIPGRFSYHYQWEGCELNEINVSREGSKELHFVAYTVVANSECALTEDYFSRLVCECNLKTNNDGEGYARFKFKSQSLLDPNHWNGVTFEEDHVVTCLQRDAPFLCEENRKVFPGRNVQVRVPFEIYVDLDLEVP